MTDFGWAERLPRALPTTPHLTVREAVNWIAFRRHSPTDLSGAAEIMAEWVFPPTRSGEDSELLFALRLMTHALPPHQLARIAEREPDWLAGAIDVAKRLVEKRNLPARDLQRLLETALRGHREKSMRIDDALSALLERCARGELTATATPVAPPGMAGTVASAHFLTVGIAITLDGDIYVKGALVYAGLKFEVGQISSIWPTASNAPIGEIIEATKEVPSVEHRSDRARLEDGQDERNSISQAGEPASDTPSREKKRFAPADVERWFLSEFVEPWKSGMPIHSGRSVAKRAEKHFPGISRDQVRKLYRDKSPSEWNPKKPGRRKNAPGEMRGN